MKSFWFVLPTLLGIIALCQADPAGTEPSPKDERLSVERDGVAVQIVVLRRAWSIPEEETGAGVWIPVKLELQITNKTERPLHFSRPDTLSLEMLDSL